MAEFFGLIARHAKTPPPSASPLAWGDPAQIETLIGGAFDLKFEPGVSDAYHESPDEIWDSGVLVVCPPSGPSSTTARLRSSPETVV